METRKLKNGGLRTKGITKTSTSEKPLITVVTVVYNGVATLEQTILSVINQTYDNVEYIVIDGASTDGTLDVIKKYEDKIDYWQSEPDKGIYDAMNKGVVLSNGEWINFMNSGDLFYEATTMKKIFIRDYSEYDVIYGNVVNKWSIGFEVKYPLEKQYPEMPFSHQSCFTKTRLVKKYKFDTDYKIAADREMFYRIIKNEKGSHRLYLNENISIFDCIDSFSVKNEVKGYKERAKFLGMNKVSFMIGILELRLKCFIKQKFPFIIDCKRKNRIKRAAKLKCL